MLARFPPAPRPADEAEPGHQLLATAAALPGGDTSLDTSINNIQDEAGLSEPRRVAAVWGQARVCCGQPQRGAARRRCPAVLAVALPSPRHHCAFPSPAS
jgi:hypothetical protein